MAYVIADNIISPLGETSEENYLAVKAGKSGIRAFAPGSHGIPDGFTASTMSADFESLVLRSVGKAMEKAHIDSHSKIAFILSSTKGPIEKLSQEEGEKSIWEGWRNASLPNWESRPSPS